MIVVEDFMVTDDGLELVRAYSDIGMMIERDGIRYAEAIDPKNSGRVYIETDEPIDKEPDEEDGEGEPGNDPELYQDRE